MQEDLFRQFVYRMCSLSRKTKFFQTIPLKKSDSIMRLNIEELDINEDTFCYIIPDYYQNKPNSLGERNTLKKQTN